MAQKTKRRFIQTSLFSEDEIIVERSRPRPYPEYMRGAVDMFLRCIKQHPEHRNIRNLQRPYMEALIKCILKDRRFLDKMLSGRKRIKFEVKRDVFGHISKATIKLIDK